MSKIYQKIIIRGIILVIILFIVFLFSIWINKKTINEGEVLLIETDMQTETIKEKDEDKEIIDNSDKIIDDHNKEGIINPEPVKQASIIKYSVPFTPQAPYADWDDPRQQDGCEEASSIMAVYWARDKSLTRYEANKMINEISNWEEEIYGSFHDTSAQDTVLRIIQRYFSHKNAIVKNNVEINDIILAIEQGNLILTPANGQILGNPYFTQPGPTTHMLVIIGYDPDTDEFITNDPGTKRGEGYRYKTSVLFNAIRDYPTGDHEPIQTIQKNIILVGK
ncbi:MAG: C39 family peptidase [bacterium]